MAELNDTQIAALREQLISKKEQLLETLRELDAQIAMKEDCAIMDAVEAASLQEVAARAGGLAQQHRRTVHAIDGAHQRIEEGTYGVCTKTGEPIPYERRELVPLAHTR